MLDFRMRGGPKRRRWPWGESGNAACATRLVPLYGESRRATGCVHSLCLRWHQLRER